MRFTKQVKILTSVFNLVVNQNFLDMISGQATQSILMMKTNVFKLNSRYVEFDKFGGNLCLYQQPESGKRLSVSFLQVFDKVLTIKKIWHLDLSETLQMCKAVCCYHQTLKE